MQLQYRWLSIKTSIDQELDLPDLVARLASTVVFDYEALLEDRISSARPT